MKKKRIKEAKPASGPKQLSRGPFPSFSARASPPQDNPGSLTCGATMDSLPFTWPGARYGFGGRPTGQILSLCALPSPRFSGPRVPSAHLHIPRAPDWLYREARRVGRLPPEKKETEPQGKSSGVRFLRCFNGEATARIPSTTCLLDPRRLGYKPRVPRRLSRPSALKV